MDITCHPVLPSSHVTSPLALAGFPKGHGMYQPSACNMLRATRFCFAWMGVEDVPRAHLMALLLHGLELGSCKEDQESTALCKSVFTSHITYVSFSEQCQHLDG